MTSARCILLIFSDLQLCKILFYRLKLYRLPPLKEPLCTVVKLTPTVNIATSQLIYIFVFLFWISMRFFDVQFFMHELFWYTNLYMLFTLYGLSFVCWMTCTRGQKCNENNYRSQLNVIGFGYKCIFFSIHKNNQVCGHFWASV